MVRLDLHEAFDRESCDLLVNLGVMSWAKQQQIAFAVNLTTGRGLTASWAIGLLSNDVCEFA